MSPNPERLEPLRKEIRTQTHREEGHMETQGGEAKGRGSGRTQRCGQFDVQLPGV